MCSGNLLHNDILEDMETSEILYFFVDSPKLLSGSGKMDFIDQSLGKSIAHFQYFKVHNVNFKKYKRLCHRSEFTTKSLYHFQSPNLIIEMAILRF